jgi:hypothetical protein
MVAPPRAGTDCIRRDIGQKWHVRIGRAGAAPLVVASLLLAPSVRAQDVSAQGVFTASIGYTDNVAFTPEPSEESPAEPEADIFSVLSPGVVVTYARPRSLYRFNYLFTTNLFFTHPEGNTVGNLVGLASRFETTETTSLILSVGAEQGQLNQVTIGGASAGSAVDFLAPTDAVYFRLTAGQGFEKALTPDTTFFQSLAGSIYLPIDQDRAYTVDGTLGVSRQWENDTGTLTAGVGYTQFENGFIATEPVDATHQLLNRITASWVHQYSEHWFHQLDLGVLLAMTLNEGGGRLVHPVGLAAVRYLRPEAQASLEYSHNAAPNVFLGTNLLSDSVVLRVAAPIAGTYFGISGSGGVSVARAIGTDGELGEAVPLYTGDAALLYNPAGGTGNIQIALRYLFSNQRGLDPPAEGEPPVGGAPVGNIIRNTLLLSIAGAYPDVSAAHAPAATPAPFRPGPAAISAPLEVPSEQADEEDEEDPNSPRSPTSPRPPAAAAPQ